MTMGKTWKASVAAAMGAEGVVSATVVVVEFGEGLSGWVEGRARDA